ncbi:MAG: GNAT family N-acetyltransferase [Bacteroidales bacterium]
MHYNNLSDHAPLHIRPAAAADLPAIMELIGQAQSDFKAAGIDQWQDGYPNETAILSDIKASESYVILSDDKIVATAMISFAGEPTYNTIEGAWITDNPYAVIHRVAVNRAVKGRGIARQIIEWTRQMCIDNGIPSIRIDTHQDNKAMQRCAARAGFRYCGIITLTSGAKRLAYEMATGI